MMTTSDAAAADAANSRLLLLWRHANEVPFSVLLRLCVSVCRFLFRKIRSNNNSLRKKREKKAFIAVQSKQK